MGNNNIYPDIDYNSLLELINKSLSEVYEKSEYKHWIVYPISFLTIEDINDLNK